MVQQRCNPWQVGTAFLASSLAVLLLVAPVAAADGASAASGSDLAMRRLTPTQYRQVITDVFGRTIKLGGRFEPDRRVNGLLALGAREATVTAAGLEQYDNMARVVAAQVIDPTRRATLIPCTPAAANAPDDACAVLFFAKAGRLLYRRALADDELSTFVAAAHTGAVATKDFYQGLGTGLGNLLVSLPFLFRQEFAEPAPGRAGGVRMTAPSKASRLSFLLWNAAPDSELLRAAEAGELDSKKGLARQADRLLASPRLEAGVRAFFTDMLAFDEFDALAKDRMIYPKFTPRIAEDAAEQTLRTVVELLLHSHGDYRDLFTTRKTFLTPLLGALYAVPVPKTTPIDGPDAWVAHEYAPNDPRAGILTQASFVALHSHPGRSSSTLRGKALRELILCQKVPNPPGNVDFTIAQNTSNPQYKTARARLKAHATEAMCAGCHKIMDPMGLALETFDSAGGYRTSENGVPIDTSGELDGVAFADAAGLGQRLRNHPATAACLVNRLYSYGIGRTPAADDAAAIAALQKGFAADGYRLPDLLRRLVTDDAFTRVLVAPVQEAAAPTEQTTYLQERRP